MYLADLPGYGYARVPEAVRAGWEAIVTAYLTERAPLALCLFLVDSRHEPSAGDRTLREWLDHFHLPYVLVATKADKLGRAELARHMEALREGIGGAAKDVIATSAETKDGIPALWRAMREAAATH
jgi:GTP-binding protein